MLQGTKRVVMQVALLLALSLVSGVAAYGGKLPRIQSSFGWPEPSGDFYRPAQPAAPGTQLLLVFIGSSTCKYSSAADLAEMVEGAKMKVAAEAKQRGVGYKVIGVAIDSDFRRGVHFLKRFGYFDEVTSGSGRFNTAFVKYVYDEMPGEAATPQILVIERSITEKDGDVSVSEERLLRRVRGRAAIGRWTEGGAVLPTASVVAGVPVSSGRP